MELTKFIVFLRNINISGKNKIAMSDLRIEFEKLGYRDVSTYLNSGNVMFSSYENDIKVLKKDIEKMIVNNFGFTSPVYVIESKRLNRIIEASPIWWGTYDKNKYDNLILILTDDAPNTLLNLIGPVSEGLEKIQLFENVIFWTFDRNAYQKCNWWKKTATNGIAEKLTIRTSNTVKNLCQRCIN